MAESIVHTDLLAYGFVVELNGKIFIGTNKEMYEECKREKEPA